MATDEPKLVLPKGMRHQLWTIYRCAKGLTTAIEKLIGREALDAAASEQKE
jgi:hypothetical protein